MVTNPAAIALPTKPRFQKICIPFSCLATVTVSAREGYYLRLSKIAIVVCIDSCPVLLKLLLEFSVFNSSLNRLFFCELVIIESTARSEMIVVTWPLSRCRLTSGR